MPETSEEGETLQIGFPDCVGSIDMVSVRVVLENCFGGLQRRFRSSNSVPIEVYQSDWYHGSLNDRSIERFEAAVRK